MQQRQWLILSILKKKPEKEAVMKENSVLGVNLGYVLLRDADIAGGVRVHRLLLALQHKLLMVHLSNVHLFLLCSSSVLIKGFDLHVHTRSSLKRRCVDSKANVLLSRLVTSDHLDGAELHVDGHVGPVADGDHVLLPSINVLLSMIGNALRKTDTFYAHCLKPHQILF